ncbi:hypothetical protein GCM10010972_34760 [Cellulomonas carbonis]|uniref:Uncharacterized protein n=1 Tax=Cellulomonas carbonis T26 TaxID=947969 RepID=A0A0A0BQ42_9CELL|nr:hypothetical protein N868_16715 [Cellulomonas carbonis T26]GGC18567.1 hypothetical protein GCM10010972_34760 [Cellulomonas carbonis]
MFGPAPDVHLSRHIFSAVLARKGAVWATFIGSPWGWCVPGSAEPGRWTLGHGDRFSALELQEREPAPRGECRRRRLWNISRYPKIAFASSGYFANVLFVAHCDDPEFGHGLLVDEAA